MNKGDIGIGTGLVAAVAICCGAKLLLVLGVGLPVLALVSGQTVLMAAATVAAIALVGIVLWRRRPAGCAERTCSPPATRPIESAEPERLDWAESPTKREPVGAAAEDPR